MPLKSLIEVAPFQYWFFFVAVLVSAILTATGIVRCSIDLAVRCMAREANRRGRSEIYTELQDATVRDSVGGTIGFLETVIYLYALVSQIHGLITAVILFKAFSGWLVTRVGEPAQEVQSFKTLTRFYVYAAGNLISLLWALAVFELLRWSAIAFEPVKRLLWIGMT